jgi:hypothetical protein
MSRKEKIDLLAKEFMKAMLANPAVTAWQMDLLPDQDDLADKAVAYATAFFDKLSDKEADEVVESTPFMPAPHWKGPL